MGVALEVGCAMYSIEGVAVAVVAVKQKEVILSQRHHCCSTGNKTSLASSDQPRVTDPWLACGLHAGLPAIVVSIGNRVLPVRWTRPGCADTYRL